MIDQSQPLILMEFNKECSVAEDDIYQFLKEIGYEWEFVSHDGILYRPRRPEKNQETSSSK